MSNLHRSLFDVKAKRPLISEDTPLGMIPREWLEHVEPYISRRGFEGCWITYKPTSRQGVPTMEYYVDGVRKQTTVAKFVMRIFWEFPDGYFIKRTCQYEQCVNPNHLYICPNAWGH
jgi:hypothetical protein